MSLSTSTAIRTGSGADDLTEQKYRLKKLSIGKRNFSKATENHQRSLDLWKDADPGIPEVEEARKRLAGLKSQ